MEVPAGEVKDNASDGKPFVTHTRTQAGPFVANGKSRFTAKILLPAHLKRISE